MPCLKIKPKIYIFVCMKVLQVAFFQHLVSVLISVLFWADSPLILEEWDDMLTKYVKYLL